MYHEVSSTYHQLAQDTLGSCSHDGLHLQSACACASDVLQLATGSFTDADISEYRYIYVLQLAQYAVVEHGVYTCVVIMAYACGSCDIDGL